MYTAVTCTGQRPELFRLCQRYVERQTVPPRRWMIFDDTGGDPPDGLPEYATYTQIQPDLSPQWARSAPWTASLALALESVEDDLPVIIMEDDDWYGAHYCQLMLLELEKNNLAVQCVNTPRYHVPARRWSIDRVFRKKPIQVMPGVLGLKAAMIPSLVKGLRAVSWDFSFPIEPMNTTNYCGIKGVGHGLPGRGGATSKHKLNHRKTLEGIPDPDWSMLRNEVGPDADDYIKMLR